MAENVIPAVVGEVVGTAASFMKNKFDKLSGVSDKVEELEWKLLKIKSAIEESKKYDIDNEPLREMQQKYIDIAKKGEDVLRNLKNQSTGPVSQSSVQDVMPSNSTIRLVWKMLTYGLVGLHFLTHPHHLVDKYVDRIQVYSCFIFFLNKVDRMSLDIGEFLEMVRQQRRKRERRRRYRPYKLFFKLILGYCRAQASRMRSMFLEMASPVYEESKLKCAGAIISAVPKEEELTDVVSLSLACLSSAAQYCTAQRINVDVEYRGLF